MLCSKISIMCRYIPAPRQLSSFNTLHCVCCVMIAICVITRLVLDCSDGSALCDDSNQCNDSNSNMVLSVTNRFYESHYVAMNVMFDENPDLFSLVSR